MKMNFEIIDEEQEKRVNRVAHTTPWNKTEMVRYRGHHLVYECNGEGRISSVKLPGMQSVPLSSLFGAYIPGKVRRRGDGVKLVDVEISHQQAPQTTDAKRIQT